MPALLGDEGQEGQGPGAFDSDGQRPLVFGAGARYTAGKDLSALRDEAAQGVRVLIVDSKLVRAKLADLLAKKALPASPGSTASAIIAVAAGILIVSRRARVLSGRTRLIPVFPDCGRFLIFSGIGHTDLLMLCAGRQNGMSSEKSSVSAGPES